MNDAPDTRLISALAPELPWPMALCLSGVFGAVVGLFTAVVFDLPPYSPGVLVAGVVAGVAALFKKGNEIHATHNPRHWVREGTGWKVPFGMVWYKNGEARAWCEESCKGRWKIGLEASADPATTALHCYGIAYFSNKRDAAAFRLFFDEPEHM